MANKTAMSYKDILAMRPLAFIAYLEQFKVNVSCHVESRDEMYAAGNNLGKIANQYSFLTSLYAMAGVMKRELQRSGQTWEYQDMIDKEDAIERAMKAVDMSYRALSKAITIHIENNKELYMTDGK